MSDRPLFSNLSMTIEGGQCTCVLGPSGCGKSTLLRMISGTTSFSYKGTIRIESEVEENGKIAWMSQNDLLLPWFSLLDNILLGAKLRNEESDALRSQARALMVEAGLTGYEKALPAKAGLGLSDVKLVNVNFSLSPSLFTGQVDGVIGAFRNFELNQMDIEKRPGRAFYVEENGIPAYDELILVANKDQIYESKLRHFVDALEEGVQYLVNHPVESWELFIKGKRKNRDDELNRRAWRDTLPRFALRPGALDKHRYQRFADFLLEQGTVKNVPPLETWAVELR